VPNRPPPSRQLNTAEACLMNNEGTTDDVGGSGDVRVVMCMEAVNMKELQRLLGCLVLRTKGLFGFILLKFNSHHINVSLNAWSTKYRLIACMSGVIYETNLLSLISPRLKFFCQIRRKCYSIC
jgi:hypothetical protein